MGKFSTILPLLALTLFILGCAPKKEMVVDFAPYTPPAALLQKSGVVYISGVVDKRPDKEIVGTIVKKGQTVSKILTRDDLAQWFKKALVSALNAEGCKVTPKSTHADKIARIYLRIDRVEAKLDLDKLTGENLTASVYVTLFIRQGKSERIIKKIGLTQKKWVPPLVGEKEIRSYLQETMEEVVNMILDHIDTYRF